MTIRDVLLDHEEMIVTVVNEEIVQIVVGMIENVAGVIDLILVRLQGLPLGMHADPGPRVLLALGAPLKCVVSITLLQTQQKQKRQPF